MWNCGLWIVVYTSQCGSALIFVEKSLTCALHSQLGKAHTSANWTFLHSNINISIDVSFIFSDTRQVAPPL